MMFTGKKAFNVLWFSQSISLLGSGMTRFALLIWAFQTEGTATALALLGFSVTITFVIASPFAGVLVDRWDRRRVMFFSDLGAGLMSAMVLVLFSLGRLQLWHLFLMEGVTGALEAFQEPAFSASVSLLVPRNAYTQANAKLGLGKSAARILAPALAGVLLKISGMPVVLLADLTSMALALAALFFLHIPQPPPSREGQGLGGQRFLRQMLFGFGYIFRRPGLRMLLFIFFLVNLFGTITYFAVLSPMILARSGGSELALSTVQAAMGVGGVAGGLLLSVWGGPRRKTRGFALATMASFLFGDFLLAVSRSVPGWAMAGFIADFTIPFIVSPYFAFWQEVVPPDVQGRVFSTREMVQVTAQPFGYLAGGLLADHLFEPALQAGGWLAGSVGLLVGTGPGAGMSAMFLCTSLLGTLTGLLGLLAPSIRRLEAQPEEPAEGPAVV